MRSRVTDLQTNSPSFLRPSPKTDFFQLGELEGWLIMSRVLRSVCASEGTPVTSVVLLALKHCPPSFRRGGGVVHANIPRFQPLVHESAYPSVLADVTRHHTST